MHLQSIGDATLEAQRCAARRQERTKISRRVTKVRSPSTFMPRPWTVERRRDGRTDGQMLVSLRAEGAGAGGRTQV